MIRQRIRGADERDVERLWMAVRSDGPFRTREALLAAYQSHPWSVRIAKHGQAAILGRWKAHLDVLAMRRVWASDRVVPAFVADACSVAAQHGFGRVMSPLLPEVMIGPYTKAGMSIVERVIALQAETVFVPAGPFCDAAVREGAPADVAAAARVDAAGFGEFWRWDEPDLLGLAADERFVVAEDGEGAVIGYTLATLDRGTVTLTRLAVAPEARRRGVGRTLIGECAQWAARSGAHTVSLCTQVANDASRGLYAASGFVELGHTYVFAMTDVAEEGGR